MKQPRKSIYGIAIGILLIVSVIWISKGNSFINERTERELNELVKQENAAKPNINRHENYNSGSLINETSNCREFNAGLASEIRLFLDPVLFQVESYCDNRFITTELEELGTDLRFSLSERKQIQLFKNGNSTRQWLGVNHPRKAKIQLVPKERGFSGRISDGKNQYLIRPNAIIKIDYKENFWGKKRPAGGSID